MGRRRLMPVAIAGIVRGRSIAPGMTGGETVVGTDGAIAMTERVTGLRDTGGGRGQGRGIARRDASVRTGIVLARSQENTGGTDRGVKSVDVAKTAIAHGTMNAITKERRALGVRRDAVPTAAEADRGRHTSTQGHAERERDSKCKSMPRLHNHCHRRQVESLKLFQKPPAAIPATAKKQHRYRSVQPIRAQPRSALESEHQSETTSIDCSSRQARRFRSCFVAHSPQSWQLSYHSLRAKISIFSSDLHKTPVKVGDWVIHIDFQSDDWRGGEVYNMNTSVT